MTNYYIQTLETHFSHEWGQNTGTGDRPVDSTNNILTSYMFDGGDGGGETPHIRTKEEYTLSYSGQNIYHFGAGGYPPAIPVGKTIESMPMVNIGDNYFKWWDKQFDNYLGFMGGSWDSSFSWTNNPDINYAGWLQELVDFIDTRIQTLDVWGEDTSDINIYIFKYRYANQPPTGWGYFPIYYRGDSVSHDLVLTPTA